MVGQVASDASERAAPAPAPGRPAQGVGHYLRDMIYGALDGVITTLAVVSGTTGAQLGVRVGVILGIANLAADGLSMGASNYLGLKSELEQTGGSVATEQPWRHGLATVAAFIVVGGVPLLGYAIAALVGGNAMLAAVGTAVATLAVVGGLRARFVARPVWKSSAEMVAIGAIASILAYGVGAVADQLMR